MRMPCGIGRVEPRRIVLRVPVRAACELPPVVRTREVWGQRAHCIVGLASAPTVFARFFTIPTRNLHVNLISWANAYLDRG